MATTAGPSTVLDADADSDLAGVVRVAAALTGLSCATVNLFDGTHQRQLSPYGFTGGTAPLADSLCATLLGSGAPVAVAGDLAAVPGLATNPWVDGRSARVRAYAGAALVVDGGTVGSLCVFDERPHDFTAAEVDRLTDLAAVLVALLERRRQAAELAASTAFTAALLEALPVGIVAADASGRVNLFNRVSRAWHGLDADPDVPLPEAPTRFGLVRTSGRTLEPAEIPLARALAEERITDTPLAIAGPDGRLRLVEVSGGPVHAPDGALLGAVVAMADVTERRALEEELRTAALHDPLTGLPNRSLLVDRLTALLAGATRGDQPFAVLYCDLDGFKPVNDRAGHATGDIVLRKAARRLRAAVRPGDTVARIGGDEFVLLCPGLHDDTTAQDVADRVTASFAEPLVLPDGARFGIGISVGAVLCDSTDTAATALARADAAMYRVKAARRTAVPAR